MAPLAGRAGDPRRRPLLGRTRRRPHRPAHVPALPRRLGRRRRSERRAPRPLPGVEGRSRRAPVSAEQPVGDRRSERSPVRGIGAAEVVARPPGRQQLCWEHRVSPEELRRRGADRERLGQTIGPEVGRDGDEPAVQRLTTVAERSRGVVPRHQLALIAGRCRTSPPGRLGGDDSLGGRRRGTAEVVGSTPDPFAQFDEVQAGGRLAERAPIDGVPTPVVDQRQPPCAVPRLDRAGTERPAPTPAPPCAPRAGRR